MSTATELRRENLSVISTGGLWFHGVRETGSGPHRLGIFCLAEMEGGGHSGKQKTT